MFILKNRLQSRSHKYKGWYEKWKRAGGLGIIDSLLEE